MNRLFSLKNLNRYSQLMEDSAELHRVALILYRKILKGVHLTVERDLEKHSLLEEFKFIFTQIEQEKNMLHKFKLLKAMDAGIRPFRLQIIASL